MPIQIKPYTEIKLAQPKIYFVSILSEGYVSWEFCMRTLTIVFHKTDADAALLTEEILTNGEAFCGGYTYEIAESKASIIEEQAKKENFSMMCLIEEV